MFENYISKIFWREEINKIVYTMNKIEINKCINKTPYELWSGHTPSVKYFRIFGRKCYIKRDYDVGKFDSRSD